MPPVAIIAGAAIGAGASLWGANKQAEASRDAASMQAQSAKDASDIQMQMFRDQQQAQKPWTEAGEAAVGKLAMLAGNQELDISKDPAYQSMRNRLTQQFGFNENDPSYQWRLKEGLKAVNESAAAKGGFFSGQTGKELQEYAQGMASTEYGNEYNRWLQSQQQTQNTYSNEWNRQLTEAQNKYNQLYGLAGMGQTSALDVGRWGTQTAGDIGRNTVAAGNAQAAGRVGEANAWADAATNVSNQLQSGIGQGLQYSMMGDYLGGGGGGGAAGAGAWTPTAYNDAQNMYGPLYTPGKYGI